MSSVFLGGEAEPVVYVDYQAFAPLRAHVECTIRIAEIVHSDRRVGSFQPGLVSVQFSSPVGVAFWDGALKRRSARRVRRGDCDDPVDGLEYFVDGDHDPVEEAPIDLDDAGALFDHELDKIDGDGDLGDDAEHDAFVEVEHVILFHIPLFPKSLFHFASFKIRICRHAMHTVLFLPNVKHDSYMMLFLLSATK